MATYTLTETYTKAYRLLFLNIFWYICSTILLKNMVIFENGYFRLDYTLSTDILGVDLPDMRTAGLSEAERCFEIMVEHVRNYNIHRLLLDSSKAIVEVGDAEYNQLIYQVSMDLM